MTSATTKTKKGEVAARVSVPRYVPPRVTPWNAADLAPYDVRHHVPSEVVHIINTPHDHEGIGNPPLWIIWAVLENRAPVIDCVCDSPESAVYHYGAVLETNIAYVRQGTLRAHVERIPANHRFASSMSDIFRPGSSFKVRLPRTGD